MLPLINRWVDALSAIMARNWITLLGSALATVGAMLVVGFMLQGLVVDLPPYAGIIGFVVFPGLFVAGLLLVAAGAWWGRIQRRKAFRDGRTEPLPYPTIDLNLPRTRRVILVVGALTIINLFIMSAATYEGIHYTDSVEFCGAVCHEVMEPEYTAYLQSHHARVACAECHIGPGASWFVQSKLSGLRQVLAVALDSHPRPIPSPVHDLRPSRDTCEQCHWPSKFTGDRVRVIDSFSEDEENTALKTILLMHIGGGNSDHHGIHSWHIDPAKRTEYFARDDAREEIVYVRVTGLDGEVSEYFADGEEDFDPATIPQGALREMDCIDCHNRPTHVFWMPKEAVDRAMAQNRIDRSLPYIKARAVELLYAAAEAEDGPAHISQELRSFYQEQYPEVLAERGAKIDEAVTELQTIYGQNVFPKMNVTWGTYPNHIGHVTATGCFRCHTDTHRTRAGESIRQDCTICHKVLAWDEANPAIAMELGL